MLINIARQILENCSVKLMGVLLTRATFWPCFVAFAFQLLATLAYAGVVTRCIIKFHSTRIQLADLAR